MGKQVTIEVNGKTYTIDCDDYINGNYAKASEGTVSSGSSESGSATVSLSDNDLKGYNRFESANLLQQYIDVFVEEAKANGDFDWRYLASLAFVESGCNPNIGNKSGYYGMFQFKSKNFCKNLQGCNDWTDWKCQAKCTAFNFNNTLKSDYNMDDTLKMALPGIIHNMGPGTWSQIVLPYFRKQVEGGQMTFNKYLEIIKTMPAQYWNEISSSNRKKNPWAGWFDLTGDDIKDGSKKRGELYQHALKYPATYQAICAKYERDGTKK